MADNKRQKHQKHSKLTRAGYGSFGRNEIAILGASCSAIKRLACELIEILSPRYNLAYVDANHTGVGDPEVVHPVPALGAQMTFTFKSGFNRFDLNESFNAFQMKQFFSGRDLIIVNGNHFPARCQVVIIDPRKSLEKKLANLTDVQLILLREGVDQVPGYLKKYLGATDRIPTFRMDETGKIAGFLDRFIDKNRSGLSGLVLVGGRSTRMHTDKSILAYHDKPHRAYLYNLLNKFCEQAYLSCRLDHVDELSNGFNIIPDSFLGLGPMGGILSAFRVNPDSAWVVLACDLPLLSHKSLRFLMNHRNPSKMATTFRNPYKAFPEPLITIWEPKSYPVLLHFLSLGYSCPRKVLINSDIELLEAPHPEELRNVNTPEEYEAVMKKLTADK